MVTEFTYLLSILGGWFIGLIILIIAGVVLFLLVRWHASNFAYQWPECEHEFAISPFTDFISPHGGGKKYLKCPRCRNRTWAIEVEKIKK